MVPGVMGQGPQRPVESAVPGEYTSERYFRTLDQVATFPRHRPVLGCSRRNSSHIQLRRVVFTRPCVAGELDTDLVRFE